MADERALEDAVRAIERHRRVEVVRFRDRTLDPQSFAAARIVRG
jgi:hypothetical protein